MMCQKCNKPFKISVVIEGKRRNLASRKFCLECSPFGEHNTRSPGRRTLPERKKCNRCSLTKNKKEFYTRRDGSSLSSYCIQCSKLQTIDRQRKLKLRAIEYKGSKCQICGYSSCAAAMDFHHINPQEKDFSISNLRGTTFDRRILDELDKCILLCSRCHREIESGFTRLPTHCTPGGI